MTETASLDDGPSAPTLSLTEGGPFVQFERRARLAEPDGRRGHRHVLGLTLPVWLVLMVFAIAGTVVGGEVTHEPVLWQFEVHVRLLIATPLLLVGELEMERRARELARRAVDDGTVKPEGLPGWQSTIDRLHALRDAWLPEAIILLAVYGVTVAGLFQVFPEQIARWLVPSLHPDRALEQRESVAWWLYIVLGQPIFLFLALRWLWRWALWSWLLVRLPWMHLDVQAGHADRAGGVGYLSGLLVQQRWFVVATGLALTSVWMDEIVWARAPQSEFAAYFLSYLVFILAISFGPHLAMTRQLIAAQRSGTASYGRLMRAYGARFEERWLRNRASAPEMLGHPDFSGLADLGSSYTVAQGMRVTLFSRTELFIVVGLVLVLVAPLSAVGMSPADIVKVFVKKIAGV